MHIMLLLLFAFAVCSVCAVPNKRSLIDGVIDNAVPAVDVSTDRMSEKPYVRFTPVTKIRKVAAGEQLVLTCEAVGVPPPAVYWTFNRKPIVQGPHDQQRNIYEKLPNADLITVQTGITGSKLTLPCVDKQNEGAFTCVANNGFANAVSNVEVIITEAENDVVQCQQSEEESALAKSGESAPVIYMWTNGRFERDGATVQLYCRAKGNPKPDIVWLNEDKQPLTDDGTFETLPNGDLLIKKASWEHLGDYICVASNRHGEDRQEAFFYPTDAKDLDAKAAAAETIPVSKKRASSSSLRQQGLFG